MIEIIIIFLIRDNIFLIFIDSQGTENINDDGIEDISIISNLLLISTMSIFNSHSLNKDGINQLKVCKILLMSKRKKFLLQ